MNSEDILELPPPRASHRLIYGNAPQQFIDVRMPPTKERVGAIMNIHGGFWRAAYDLAHAGHLCAALTGFGFATFNVEYRRVGDAGGGWPASLDDVSRAYSYIQQQYSWDSLIVMGHSAGGQLALALAAQEPRVTQAVSLVGLLDLHRAYDLHLSDDAVVDFLGGTPQQIPERYKEASPLCLNVAAHQIIITGDSDDVVPPAFSCEYFAQKKKAGEKLDFIEIPHAGHYDLIDPRTEAFAKILEALAKFR